MVKQWASDDNYSHGFLVPIISLYLAYMRKNELQNATIRPCNYGIFLVAFGVMMLILGWVCYGTPDHALVDGCGHRRGDPVSPGLGDFQDSSRAAVLPLSHGAHPAVLYDAAAFPLKLFVTKVSVLSMKALGIVVWQEGNVLMFPNITLEVADACSGLRSIMSLLALGAAYAFVLHTKTRDRVILILSTCPSPFSPTACASSPRASWPSISALQRQRVFFMNLQGCLFSERLWSCSWGWGLA
jgi:hypothetical protein